MVSWVGSRFNHSPGIWEKFISGSAHFMLVSIWVEYLKEAWQEDLSIKIIDSRCQKGQEHLVSMCQIKAYYNSRFYTGYIYQNANCLPSWSDSFCYCILWSKRTNTGFSSSTCPNIPGFCTKTFQALSEVLIKQIARGPNQTLFWVKAATLELSNNQYMLIWFALLLARKLILLNWKQTKPPTLLTVM